MVDDASGDGARQRSAKAFGAAMKRQRMALDMSQEELVERLKRAGMRKPYQMLISRIESGEREVSLYDAGTIAAVLNVPLSTLASGEPVPEYSPWVTDAKKVEAAFAAARREVIALAQQILPLQEKAGELSVNRPADIEDDEMDITVSELADELEGIASYDFWEDLMQASDYFKQADRG